MLDRWIIFMVVLVAMIGVVFGRPVFLTLKRFLGWRRLWRGDL